MPGPASSLQPKPAALLQGAENQLAPGDAGQQAAGAAQQLSCAATAPGPWGTGGSTDGSKALLNLILNLMHPQGSASSTTSGTGLDKQGKKNCSSSVPRSSRFLHTVESEF